MLGIMTNELDRYALQQKDLEESQFSRASKPDVPEKGFKSAKIAIAGGKIRKSKMNDLIKNHSFSSRLLILWLLIEISITRFLLKACLPDLWQYFYLFVKFFPTFLPKYMVMTKVLIVTTMIRQHQKLATKIMKTVMIFLRLTLIITWNELWSLQEI